jgi:signal transduction histidine kinase
MSTVPVAGNVAVKDAPYWRRVVADLSVTKVLVAVAGAFAGALLLSPIFAPSLPVVFSRTLFVAIVLLLAHSAAGQWRNLPLPLPRWLVQVLSVVVAAPLATLAVYAVATGGNVESMFGPERVSGMLFIGGFGLFLGLILALGALYRERDAQANAQALQFALERETLQRQAADAKLAVLQSQIEPHFLFNTLANVQALVESGSPRAAPVLASLIEYLRAAIPRIDDGAPTLGSEEALVRAYLEVMQMRMPDRLQYSVTIDPTLRAQRLPAMLLLTLVENAVRHGIDQSEVGGHIEVGAQLHAATGRVRLWVKDTGVGIDESRPFGTGLANLRARLAATYGDRAQLHLSAVSPHGVHAEIELPADT